MDANLKRFEFELIDKATASLFVDSLNALSTLRRLPKWLRDSIFEPRKEMTGSLDESLAALPGWANMARSHCHEILRLANSPYQSFLFVTLSDPEAVSVSATLVASVDGEESRVSMANLAIVRIGASQFRTIYTTEDGFTHWMRIEKYTSETPLDELIERGDVELVGEDGRRFMTEGRVGATYYEDEPIPTEKSANHELSETQPARGRSKRAGSQLPPPPGSRH